MIESQIPIVQTKFYLPREISAHVTRGRLVELMQRALRVPLTLVSAPAGYGKSVLVGDWSRSLDIPVVWISLDDTESDLRQFMAYLLAGIEGAVPQTTLPTRELLISPGSIGLQELVFSLVNDLDECQPPLAIILDDYHVIAHTSPVHEFFTLFLKHPPENVHLVLVTRRDPPLPLAKMRAGSELAEIRLEDLRFRQDETAEMLAVIARDPISAPVIENVQRQLEGWVAGLRMVVLAMQSVENGEAFLQSLAGGIPQMQDYFLEEVLGGLAPEFRDYLLRSALPKRFCVELIEALDPVEETSVEPLPSASDFVRFAYENNLFTFSMDTTGTWFRYHHLFRELLLRQAERHFGSTEITQMNLRASAWLAAHEYVTEAIQQALVAGDIDSAVAIVEHHNSAEFDEDRWYVVRGWLQLFPTAVRQQRPELLLAEIWVATYRFELEKSGSLLQHLEVLDKSHSLSEQQLGELNYFRGVLAYWEGDAASCRDYLEQSASVYYPRGVFLGEVQVYLALGRCLGGDADLAIATLEQQVTTAAGRPDAYATRITAAQSYMFYIGLDPARALRTANHLFLMADEWGNGYARAWGAYMRALVHLNTLQLPDACADFARVNEHSNLIEPRMAVDALLGHCLARQLQGQSEMAAQAAKDMMDIADLVQNSDCIELAISGSARLALLRGDIDTAAKLAKSVSARPKAGNLFFWLEEPVITRARIRIARGKPKGLARVLQALQELQAQIESQHLQCRIVDVMLLQAVANEALGERAAALVLMERAVEIAAAADWLRPFCEIGGPLLPLIEALEFGETEQDFVIVLRQHLGESNTPPALPASTESEGQLQGAFPVNSQDGLTNRELDILELLSQRYRNKEIAAKLFISTHTVNYHLKHIYQKLDVTDRRQAVGRAQELGLLDPR